MPPRPPGAALATSASAAAPGRAAASGNLDTTGGDGIGVGVGTRGLAGRGGAAATGGTLGVACFGRGGGSGRAARGRGRGGALGEAGGARAWRAIAMAARMSPADAKRFSRSFSSERFTTATMPVGTSGAQRRTGGACRWTTWKRTLGVESASKGLWPVSSS